MSDTNAFEQDDFVLEADDFVAEQQTEVESEQADAETSAQVTNDNDGMPVESDNKPYTVLKYNHSELPITSKEEADKLAQIGYHYENKLKGEYEAYKDKASKVDAVAKVAEMYDMDIDTMVNMLAEQYYKQKAEIDGVNPDVIKRERQLAEREKQLNAIEQSKQQESKREKDLQSFFSAHPDVKPSDIKPETIAKLERGIDLETAYTQQVNEELKQKLSLLETQQANSKRPPIKGVGSSATEGKKDTFLSAWED